MAAKTKIIGWNPKAVLKEMTDNAIALQTERLVEYAKEEIKRLGDMIQTYNSRNHMDRTGNLLNSLCWGVTYNGEMKESGFYREPQNHSRGIGRSNISYLHEFFPNDQYEVNGRQLAENFVKEYKGKSSGWSTFFAVLAPYWGYWESGFKMKSGGGNSGIPRSTRFLQFQVMSHIFDDVRLALKPAKTHLTVYVPKYQYKNPKYKKKGTLKIGVLR